MIEARDIVGVKPATWDAVGFVCEDHKVLKRGASTYAVLAPSALILRSRKSPRSSLRIPGSRNPVIVSLGFSAEPDVVDALASLALLASALDLVRSEAEWVFVKWSPRTLQSLSFYTAGIAEVWGRIEAGALQRTKEVLSEVIEELNDLVKRVSGERSKLIMAVMGILSEVLLSAAKRIGERLSGQSARMAGAYVRRRILEEASRSLLNLVFVESKRRGANVVWITFPSEIIVTSLREAHAAYAGEDILWLPSQGRFLVGKVWLFALSKKAIVRLEYPASYGKSLGEDAAAVLASLTDKRGEIPALRLLEQQSRIIDEG